MTLGDRNACVYNGIFHQIGTPEEVYDNPVNKFVAGFSGSPSMNFIEGKLDGSDFVTPVFSLNLPESMVTSILKNATDVNNIILGIRPENIEDREFALNPSVENIVTVKVMVRENYGSDIFLSVQVDSIEFNARVNTATTASVDQRMDLVFDMSRVHIFDRKTEKNLTI